MSHCLGIPEILRIVCDSMDEKTCLSIALTSRAFVEPALDRIWHGITSFQPLISCLPEGLLDRDDKNVLSPRRTVVGEDLNRYLTFYAHRIRSFALRLEEETLFLSIEALVAFQIATEYRLGALSPFLLHFEWPSPQLAYRHFRSESSSELLASYMALFVGEGTRRVDLEWHNNGYPLYGGSVLFQMNHLPNLKELRLLASEPDTSAPCFLKLFPWSSLETIVLGGMEFTDQLFLTLAKLPCLRRLELNDTKALFHELESEDAMQSASVCRADPTSFISLDTLITRSWAFAGSVNVLGFLPENVRLGRLVIESESNVGSKECQVIVDAIQKCCNRHTLRCFEFYECTLGWGPPAELLDLEEEEREDVNPWTLGDFSALTTLTIQCGGRVNLQREDIGKFTATWPKLHHLDFCSMQYSRGQVPAFDHRDLLKVVEGLPSLRYLGLRFDSTQLPADQTPPTTGPFELHTFRVGDSPIRSPSRVAKFLKDYFPFLKELNARYLTPNSIQRPSMLDRRWAEVVKLLA